MRVARMRREVTALSMRDTTWTEMNEVVEVRVLMAAHFMVAGSVGIPN